MTGATKALAITHIVKTPGICGGRPRIAGRRIRVQDVYLWHEQRGMAAAEIARELDLTLGQVHAALSYAFDHDAEIQADLQATDALVEEAMQQNPSKLQQKLSDQDA